MSNRTASSSKRGAAPTRLSPICGPSNAGLEGIQDQSPCKKDADCYAKSGCRGAQTRVKLMGKPEMLVGNMVECDVRQSVLAQNR
jgi:hypothetical protein